MSLSVFDRFVAEEKEKAGALSTETPFDPELERQEWLGYLRQLYTLAVSYLESYVEAGQIEISYRDITLNEEAVGAYNAPEMLIRIGTKRIRLEPIGTFLIGSKGRVDVVGPIARTQLLLLNNKIRNAADLIRVSVSLNGGPLTPPASPPSTQAIEWAWRLISRPPERKIMELTKEVFLEMLLEIANG